MSKRTAIAIWAIATLGFAVGCAAQPTAEEEAVGQDAATVSAHQAAAGGPQVVSGAVLESMDAAGYTYARVDLGDSEVWVASNRYEVEVGDRVSFPLETPMKGFHSEALDRDFPLIYFASFVVPEGEVPQAAPATIELPPGHPSLDAFAVDADKAATVAIEQPSGGATIAEVWQRRVELEGRRVTVRGKVVKYNAAILSRNWLHIQDGSGELAQGTNDLTVTTEATVAVGDVVTVTGTVAVDRDFGAGYTYTVMLEDAVVSP